MYKYRYEVKRIKVGEIEDTQCSTPNAVADYAKSIIGDKEKETLIAIMLTTRNRVIGHYIVSVGLLDRAQAHAREVFREAIIRNSAKVVLAHNHPSGDPTPSRSDKQITIALDEAGKVIGIELIDHIIIGDPNYLGKYYYSFREAGELS